MIISTSSHNVMLTDAVYEYAEDALRREFENIADDIVSIDARIDAGDGTRGRGGSNVVVRVDSRNDGPLVTRSRDANLYAAIRRGAAEAAQTVNHQVQRSRKVIKKQPPRDRLALNRCAVINL